MVADRGQHPADAQGADAQDVAHAGDPVRDCGLRLRWMLRRDARLAIQQGQAHVRAGRGAGAHRHRCNASPAPYTTRRDQDDAGAWESMGAIQYATIDRNNKIRKEVIIMARKTLSTFVDGGVTVKRGRKQKHYHPTASSTKRVHRIARKHKREKAIAGGWKFGF
jgi:hypothetical protein